MIVYLEQYAIMHCSYLGDVNLILVLYWSSATPTFIALKNHTVCTDDQSTQLLILKIPRSISVNDETHGKGIHCKDMYGLC